MQKDIQKALAARAVLYDFSPRSTDQTTIPVAAVYGKSTGTIAPASNGYDNPVATSITFASGVGSFAAGDSVCVLPNGGAQGFEEQSVITSVSGTAGTQTITLPLALPQYQPAVFKGYCMYLSFDADAAQGIRYALPAVSLDGTHILYGYSSFSNMSRGPLPASGITFASFDGGTSSGWHLYRGARVWKLDTTAPNSNKPLQISTTITYVEPNGTFAPGDAVEAIEFPAQKVDGLDLYAGMDMPATSASPNTALNLHLQGRGNNSNAAILRIFNEQATSTYKPFGGPISEPEMIVSQGPFDYFSRSYYTPLTTAFQFDNHQPGQTSYNVWADGWGSLKLDNTNTWNFVNSSVYVQGSGTTGGLMSAGVGFASGSGNGAGNFAGLEFQFGNGTRTPVWIAQEYSLGNTNDHLAITKQGAARVPGGDYYAAPDGTLDMANLNVGTAANIGALTVTSCSGCFNGGTITNPLTASTGATGTPLIATSSNTSSTNIELDNTTAGAHNFIFYSTGSGNPSGPGLFGTYDLTSNAYLFNVGGGATAPYLSVRDDADIGWASTHTGLQTRDTGLSRCTSTADCVAVGNGTAGDISGTLKAANYGAGTLANGMIATTQSAGDNSTKVATTAYVDNLPRVHSNYANIPGVLFATNAMLGPVFYEPQQATYKTMIVRLSGAISCSVSPVVVLADLGVSPSTSYGSLAGTVDSVTTGTAVGVYQHTASISLTPGHYYGFAFSGGTCTTAPTFDITAEIQ